MLFRNIRRKQDIRTCCHALAMLLLFAVSSSSHAAFETSLSTGQIEKVLEQYFPLNEYAAFARMEMHRPQVRLVNGNEKIVLIVPVVANIVGGEKHQGHATISVSLAYKPHIGGVYFSQPELLELAIPGVDGQMQSALKGIIDVMSQNSFPVVKIYTVKERMLNHTLAKSTLKSFRVADDKLHLVIGFK